MRLVTVDDVIVVLVHVVVSMLTSVEKSDEYTISVWNMGNSTCRIMGKFCMLGKTSKFHRCSHQLATEVSDK